MANGSRPDIVADFKAGFDTLRRHPMIAAPPLIAIMVGFVLKLVFLGAGMGMFTAGRTVNRAWVALAAGLLLSLASAVVVVMARDAIAPLEPSIGAAVDVVMSRLGAVVIMSAIFAVIVGIASLSFVIIGLIAAFPLIFTMPAILLDGLGPVDAIGRSIRLVKDGFGHILGLVIGAIVGIALLSIVSAILSVMPLVGPLAVTLLAGAFFAYVTVVVVRVYLSLASR